MHAAPHAAAVLIIASAPAALGWTSVSQTLGTSLDQIRSTVGGDDSTANYNADQLLGYLWTVPFDDTSTRGLGGGITYAWDPDLCEKIVPAFREDFNIFINCRALRSGIHRAFNSWQDLHSTVKFHDVTEICDNSNTSITTDVNGTRNSDCPYKEVPGLLCEPRQMRRHLKTASSSIPVPLLNAFTPRCVRSTAPSRRSRPRS